MAVRKFIESRAAAGAAATGASLLAAAIAVGQTVTSGPGPAVSISPPASGEAVVVAVTTPIDTRAGLLAARIAVRDAVAASVEAMPVVPWTAHGLSGVALEPEWIRYDEARALYVADLPDGRVAILTLMPRVQRRIEGVLARFAEPGEALVAIEPRTGRVLALVDDGADLAIGPGLARRAVAYAASTFKVITGAALLEQGGTTLDSETCFSGGGDGFREADLTPAPATDAQCLSMRGAIAWSANLYFGRRADQHLTPAALQETAERFGFNMTIPFELPVEPSTAHIPEERLGFTRAAAGFYSTTMSALHGAMIQAAIANGGEMMVPAIIDRIETPDGAVVYQHTPAVWRVAASPELAGQLIDVQSDTCQSGTARGDFAQRDGWPASIRAWGKTGTLANRLPDGTEATPSYIYRWFTGAGARGDETLAVAGLVVNTPQWWIKGSYLASEALVTRFP